MKKIIFVLAALLTMNGICMATDSPVTQRVITNQSIKNSAYTSGAIELIGIDGQFSLQVHITGAGSENVDVDYLISNDGNNFITPEGDATPNIYDDYLSTSGPGSDGIAIKQFRPHIGKYIKIRATETADNTAVVNAWLTFK